MGRVHTACTLWPLRTVGNEALGWRGCKRKQLSGGRMLEWGLLRGSAVKVDLGRGRGLKWVKGEAARREEVTEVSGGHY